MKTLHYDVPTLVPMPRFEDARGSVEILMEDTLDMPVIIKRAVSTRGVVRGFHWQKAPSPQTKLIYVIKGAIRDITVRVEGDWPDVNEMHTIDMSAKSPQCLYIPPNYAHAYQYRLGRVGGHLRLFGSLRCQRRKSLSPTQAGCLVAGGPGHPER